MKRILLTLSIFGACLFTANAQTKPATPAPAEQPASGAAFKFEKETYDFGTIKQGEVVTHEFTFVNSGTEPLIINNAQAQCGCTVPSWPKEPIKPGEKGTIKVSFNSTGKMGLQDKTVTLTSNAGEGSKVLHLKGTIEAKPVEEAFPAKKPAEGAPVEKGF